MNVFVVIPNWNGADMLAECLISLQNQTLRPSIIVVDNGSTDGSQELLDQQFSGVTVLKNNKNEGFTGGVNPGIQYAIKHGADAVALFNNDAVAEKTWLAELVTELETHPESGIVTSRLMRSDNTYFDSTGDYYSTWGIPFPRGRNQVAQGTYLDHEEVFGASGGASLYRTTLLNEIGTFDQRFFAYYEDVDISFRAQLAGWKVRYTPMAVAYHHIGGTSSKMGDFTRYHSIKNFLILYTKDMPAQLYWKYLPTFLYQFARTTARSILDRKPHVWLHAVGSFCIMLPGILKDRRAIQKKRTLTTQQVEQILHVGRPPRIQEIPEPVSDQLG